MFLDDTASSDDISYVDRFPTLVLLFQSMHLVSVLRIFSGLGTFQPVTRTSIYFSTSNTDDILAAIPASAAAAAGINPPPQLNPVPVWRPLLGLHVLSEDAAVDGHTVLTRSGSAVIALPAPGSLLRALKLVVEDAAAPGGGGGGGVQMAALQEVNALAPAAHNPQVHRPPPPPSPRPMPRACFIPSSAARFMNCQHQVYGVKQQICCYANSATRYVHVPIIFWPPK